MGIGDNFIVGDFMFCNDHGLEFCWRCGCDHRMCNNIRIEEYVEQYKDQDTAVEALEALDEQEREPLNINFFGERTSRRHNGEPVFKCYKHKTNGCNVCFDFVRYLLEQEGLYRDLDDQEDEEADADYDDDDEEDGPFGSQQFINALLGGWRLTSSTDIAAVVDEPPPLVDVFENERGLSWHPTPLHSAPLPSLASQVGRNVERVNVPVANQPRVPAAAQDAVQPNPLLRHNLRMVPKHRRISEEQRPGNPTIINAMSSRDCPRRFVPPTSNTRPTDIFSERLDFIYHRFPRYFHEDDDRTMLVYTDGACLDQDGGSSGRRRAGCSFVYCDSKRGIKLPLEGSIGGAEQTSNRAELRAVLLFLQMRHWEAGGVDRIVIATDSEYVVDGVCERLDKWVRRQWRTAGGTLVKHKDLWEALFHEIRVGEQEGLQLLFWRIPREWNQRADTLAKEAADLRNRKATPSIVVNAEI